MLNSEAAHHYTTIEHRIGQRERIGVDIVQVWYRGGRTVGQLLWWEDFSTMVSADTEEVVFLA